MNGSSEGIDSHNATHVTNRPNKFVREICIAFTHDDQDTCKDHSEISMCSRLLSKIYVFSVVFGHFGKFLKDKTYTALNKILILERSRQKRGCGEHGLDYAYYKPWEERRE